jgi:hypothetical protein
MACREYIFWLAIVLVFYIGLGYGLLVAFVRNHDERGQPV